MPTKIKAIIFDCFGVVVGQGFNETYRSAGGDPVTDRAFIDDVLYQSNLGLIPQSQFRQEIAEHLHISLDDWQTAVDTAEQPNIELLEYIVELRKKFKMGMLSNANAGVLPRKIGADWLERCFDAVVVSAEVGKIKPDPEIYLYTAAKLGVSPAECVFFDDHARYTEAADAVGMRGIQFKSFRQARAELEKILADN
jgi:putative hydrolase of the HAD superfamily